MRFNVGDKVKVRDWEELEEVYGIQSGVIKVNFGYTEEMRDRFQGKELEIEVIDEEDQAIQVKDYPDFFLDERVLKYPDEPSTFFKKWETTGNQEAFEKANEFYENAYSRCGLNLGNLSKPINPEYAWEILRLLYLPVECTVDYIKSDEYELYKDIAYGLIAKSSISSELDNARLASMLCKSSDDFNCLALIEGKPNDDAVQALTDLDFTSLELSEDLAGRIKVADDHEYVVYIKENDVVIFTTYTGNEIVRGLYAILREVLHKPEIPGLKEALDAKNQEQMYKAVNDYLVDWDQKKADIEITCKIMELGDFYRRNEEESTRRTIEQGERRVRDLEADLREIHRQIKEARLRSIGLLGSDMEKNVQMFIEQMSSFKNRLTDLKIEDSVIKAVVVMPLTYWSEDEWSAVKHRYEGSRNYRSKLFMDIFEYRKYTLTFQQGFYFDFERNKVGKYNDYRAEKGIPNPHMYSYDCWGDNKHYIEQYMSEYDLTMAFGQVFSAISGINVSDSAVFDKLYSYLEYDEFTNIPCLKNNETGEIITIEQYAKSNS